MLSFLIFKSLNEKVNGLHVHLVLCLQLDTLKIKVYKALPKCKRWDRGKLKFNFFAGFNIKV